MRRWSRRGSSRDSTTSRSRTRFKFVSAREHRHQPGELRFDMFDGEFTHQGELCSFEVLLARFELTDAALRAIAEIVHDIDLKDEKYVVSNALAESPRVGRDHRET